MKNSKAKNNLKKVYQQRLHYYLHLLNRLKSDLDLYIVRKKFENIKID
jgi:hypothetical protein